MSRFLDALPALVIDEQLERLQRAFPGRRGELDGFASELRHQTEGWTVEEFIGAIDAVVREENAFPKIAKILKHRPERLASAPTTHTAGCFRCGVEPYLAGFETARGEVVARYRCDCNAFQRGGWTTDRARAWREDQAA